MAKLYAAVVFAFIAAMVIVITGLSSDARGMTIFFRSIIGFISAGLIVYILLRILAAKDILDFDDFIEARDESALAEVQSEGETAADETSEAAAAESPAQAGEAETAETGGQVQFEPLSSDDLTRMKPPE